MANAFYDIAPKSAACTSSSKKPCYDVFINHRGKDVNLTLASCIYQMLGRMGVQVFLDQEELDLGDSFPEAIEEAMRSASVHIAIFSPSYAESPWCLEELLLMLQMNVTIIPVFYGVEATDLRYATKGIYADAFRQHQRKHRYNPEKIKEWEEALNRVSFLNGCIVADEKCDQGKLLRNIVDTALNKMKKMPLEVATFPVGLDEAVEDFEREVGPSTSSENVHMVGIVGMGGIGKTTLAKELYNRKRSFFMNRCSFLFNVKAASSTNSLHKLQKKLFKDFLIQYRPFDNKEEGILMLAKDLSSMAVLIVLDDVDNVDQIRALLPRNLGRGSLIIVTTREKKVLQSWGISSVYPMKRLDPFNAKLLFCSHAFSQPYSQLVFEHPAEKSHNFEYLIERFVEACIGLPLSLKVLGAMLNGQSEDYWEDQFQKEILPKDIAETLKLSYDALDAEVRQMFLDVACFFIGETKNLAVQIWYGSRWRGELGWETLVNKCLVEVDKEGNIEMHDHLRDLGRQIARDISPSRIWKEEHISTQDGRTPIRGIVAGRRLHSGTSALATDTYYALPLDHYMDCLRPSLRALQLVAVKGNDFREAFVTSSIGLVWLRLWDFTGSNLPSWLSLKSLTVLELYNAQNLEELWPDNVQPPSQLRELIVDLTAKICFQGLPSSIGDLKLLKKIVLNGSGNGMKTLPEEFCHLESLEILQLSYFSALSSLPDQFGALKKLRILIFSGVQLVGLPNSFKQLRLLEFLEISNSQTFFFRSEMLDVLEFMTKLQTLKIQYCPQLVELPQLTTLVSLRELDLTYTGLRDIPHNIGRLTKLETLGIGSDNLTSLPESIGELSCLTSLAIYDCDLLKSLPETVGRLSNLQSLKIEDTPIVELDLGIGSASGCNLSSLKCLSLFNTPVSTISISDECCPRLEALRLRCNSQLLSISNLPKNVREIMVYGCEKLWNMMAISCLLNLENLVITDCPKLELLQIPAYMFCVPRRISITGCPKAFVGVETSTQVREFSDKVNVAALQKMKKVPLELATFSVELSPGNHNGSQKISEISPIDLFKSLKLSYDALDYEVQQMFLDVACFFIGGKKSMVVAIWDGSGWSGDDGWETLVNKCLIEVDEEDNIKMHDHLRDLGRKIAGDVSFSPSRIWNKEQMSIRGRRSQIRGIMVGLRAYGLRAFHTAPLGHLMDNIRPSLHKLQLLAVKGNYFREELVASSRDLIWLHLREFDGVNLPLWLSLANLRVLELDGAANLEELWQDNVQPPLQLRELVIKLTRKSFFGGLPRSIGHLRFLKKIVLNGCGSGMKSLPEEFCHLQSLEFFRLSDSPELSSLPDDFGKLMNLRDLDLFRVQLTGLPHSFKHLRALQSLSISGSRSFKFTSEMLDVLEFMTELQVLRIGDCPELDELPHLRNQVSLRKLKFQRTGLRELPESLGALLCLTSLEIRGCKMLESLPEALGNLSHLQSLNIHTTPVVEIGLGIGSPWGCNLKSLKSLELIDTLVCRISIPDDCCPRLEHLLLQDNKKLTEIETLPGCVIEIIVHNSIKLKSMRGIRDLLNLVRLEVDDCPDLEVLPCPTYMHSVGHTVSVKGCPKAAIMKF